MCNAVVADFREKAEKYSAVQEPRVFVDSFWTGYFAIDDALRAAKVHGLMNEIRKGKIDDVLQSVKQSIQSADDGVQALCQKSESLIDFCGLASVKLTWLSDYLQTLFEQHQTKYMARANNEEQPGLL